MKPTNRKNNMKIRTTIIAVLMAATTAFAEDVATMAANAGVSVELAKKLLAAGFHYNKVDHSFEGGALKGTDKQRAETFANGPANKAASKAYSETWQYMRASGYIWLTDPDGGARPHHYYMMRATRRLDANLKRVQYRLDDGTWIWVRRDY
jgi:hypothetical protein